MLPTSPGLIVSNSKIGKGIFTTKRFQKAATLFTVTGSFVSGDITDDMDEQVRNNLFRYDADRYVNPAGTIGDFLNHSCMPNAKVVKRRGVLCVVSLCPIPVGCEVTIDYSTITAMDDSWTMRCRCSERTCRKTIRSFDTLPQRLRNAYIKDRVVPSYILSIDRMYTGSI